MSVVQETSIWMYFLIPIISGFIGWITNRLALKMTFKPLRFFGIGPIGWQGIIPSRSKDMAAKAVELMSPGLISVEEVFNRLEDEELAARIDPPLYNLVESTLLKEFENEMPLVWSNTPSLLKSELFELIKSELPSLTRDMIADIREHIETLFDLKGMVVNTLEQDKALLNEIFHRSGHQEFKFIERSGFYLGFLFGIIQALIMFLGIKFDFNIFIQAAILPVAGLGVGWATNYLALKMIFEPKEEKKFLGFRYQGLFLKRQAEVSVEYSEVVSNKILTPIKIFDYIITGPRSENLIILTQKHVSSSFENIAGIFEPMFKVLAGKKGFLRIREHLCNTIIAEMPNLTKPALEYSKRTMAIGETLRKRMSELSSSEFEGFLRPIFEKDEWKLILIGAILGLAAGFLQLIYLFVETWNKL